MPPKTPKTPTENPNVPESAPAVAAPPPPPPPPPVAESGEAAKKVAGKGKGIPLEAIQRGAESRVESGIFNDYLKACAKKPGARTEKHRARVAEIDALLSAGSRLKNAPIWEGTGKDRTRKGSVEKLSPLLPAEKIALMRERAELNGKIADAESGGNVKDDLRAEFRRILPGFAKRHGYGLDMLRAVGIPDADLEACGLLPAA